MTLAQSRGHIPVDISAKPSFANILVWKLVYSTETDFYVDAVKVGFKPRIYEGSSIAKLNVEDAFPWLDEESQQHKDIDRFRWFSNGYVALSPGDPNTVIDIRYSLLPNKIRGLWGIQLDQEAEPDQHVTYITQRKTDEIPFAELWSMIVN